jgi:L-iditol 2-dehydrogenase
VAVVLTVGVAGANVIMVGTSQDTERLKLAQELGADGAIDVQQTKNVAEVIADSLGTDGADLVIECSGAAPATKTISDVARRGARFWQMGLYGKPVWFDQDAVCYKESVVTGANATVTSSWIRA